MRKTEQKFDVQYLYQVFQKNGFNEIVSIELVKNDHFSLLYHINDEFMIEFSKQKGPFTHFKTTVDLYRYYGKSIQVPRVLIYDQSKKSFHWCMPSTVSPLEFPFVGCGTLFRRTRGRKSFIRPFQQLNKLISITLQFYTNRVT